MRLVNLAFRGFFSSLYLLQLSSKLSYHLVDLKFVSLSTKENQGWFMVFNATFNNISVISWRSKSNKQNTLCIKKYLLIMFSFNIS